jgi:hypothetical protein
MTDETEGRNAERGFRRIGSLLPSNLPSLTNLDLMDEARRTISETTGIRNLPAEPSSTGPQHSVSGAERKPAELVLAARSAASERDSKAAIQELLRRQLGSCGDEVYSSRFGVDGQYEPHLDSIRLPAASLEAFMQTWGLVEPLTTPARNDPKAQRKIAEEWARLRAVTISRNEADLDAELGMDTVLDELERYPADCVLRALKAWRNGHKWRPSLSEILTEVQWRARYRRRLREAFEKIGVS